MQHTIPYRFHDHLVLRTPGRPFNTDFDEKTIVSLLDDELFMEAIYLASPVLYKECQKWKKGELKTAETTRILESLARYYQRMSSRCTPFGLFSGCTVAKWDAGKTSVRFSSDGHVKHTRLDMHYLCALSQKLASLPCVKNKLLYFPNTSLYIIADEVRYVEYKYRNGKRVHQITSVSNSEYLQKILEAAKDGINIGMARNILSRYSGTDDDEAGKFIDDLIAAQLLVSELEPCITGKEYIHQLLDTLLKYYQPDDEELGRIIEILNAVKDMLQCNENRPRYYSKVIELISLFEAEFDESRLFQVDFFKKVQTCVVSREIQEQLLSALEVLVKLYTERTNENLDSFAKRFYDRYEHAAKPLLEVLDTETGIGYPENSGYDFSPLIEGLNLPATTDAAQYKIQWNATQQWLFEKLKKAIAGKDYTLEITDDEVRNLQADWENLPPSLSAMFRIVDAEKKIIFADSFPGTSAANLLARFAHGDADIHTTVFEITRHEQELNPDIIFAEIVHLPESRTANILAHPVFREFEIPYLAKPAVDKERAITMDDLYVSVEGNHVKLFSKKLNKRVIPRLSSAHNFSYDALPVYRFLGDLQSQGLRHGFSFHWGSMARQFRFLPRVMYRNVILHEATWQLKKADYAELLAAANHQDEKRAREYLKGQGLPRFFVLADGDNELLVDSENNISLQIFCKAIKNRETVIVKEFFVDPLTPVTDEEGNIFSNQFIASLVKTQAVYTSKILRPPAYERGGSAIQRTFIPGSEWLYYKFYCGYRSAEKVLTGLIQPLTQKLMEKGIIQKWFFVRYNDPGFHLRLRLQLTSRGRAGTVIKEVIRLLDRSALEAFIWKIQIDTYQRELERYSFNTMELSEELFYHDSTSLLEFLNIIAGDNRENERWQWAICITDELLNAFRYDEEKKLRLFSILKDNLAAEFRSNKALLRQINKKYNDNRGTINALLLQGATNVPGDNLLRQKAVEFGRKIGPLAERIDNCLAGQDQGKITGVLGSYLHMSLNRLFPSEARLQEYIIYEFMNRWYTSSIARSTVL